MKYNIELPKQLITKIKEYSNQEDIDYLVSVAINAAAPDSSCLSGEPEKIKINLCEADFLLLQKRSVMIGEDKNTLLAQLLQNYV